MPPILKNLDARIKKAVSHYWLTRASQSKKNAKSGKRDYGTRGEVTGGKHMDGFAILVKGILIENGLPEAEVFLSKKLVVPGFFRATKKWDLLVMNRGKLVAAMELKSQVGSFGKNFNNRAEEVIGSAQDFWTAYREGAFAMSPKPWLGSLVLLEDCDETTQVREVDEPLFKVFKVFNGTSYSKRYEILLRKLVRERLYDSAAFLMSRANKGRAGQYSEPASDMTIKSFLADLAGRCGTISASQT